MNPPIKELWVPRAVNRIASRRWQAKPENDFVCETDHGCDPIPVTRAMFGALQRTDPRCGDKPASAEDQEALRQLGEVVKLLTKKE